MATKKQTKLPLNPVAKKWVKALRSGKYKQGKRGLRTEDSFCCLGVLCDLAVQEGVIKVHKRPDDRFKYGGQFSVLPEKVRRWVGLDDAWGSFTNNIRGCSDLVSLNDEGSRFKTIANIIESQPEGLFDLEEKNG